MARQSGSTGIPLKRQFLSVALLATVPLLLLTIVSNILFYRTTRQNFEEQIRSNSQSIHNIIRVQVDNSIRAYLRAKAETALNLLERTDSEPERLDAAIREMMDINIGETGYFYGLDSEGTIMFHPDPNLIGDNLANTTPVKEQLAKRSGYFEYDWQNTYESSLQAKALYMFEWDRMNWIVTATSYRREFSQMVDMEAVSRIIRQSRFGESGYTFIVNRQGHIIAHPNFSGREEIIQILEAEDYEAVIETLFEKGEGIVTYQWKDDVSEISRGKIVFLKYLPDYDWVIGTAAYRTDLTLPFLRLMVFDITFALVVGFVLTLILHRLNRGISRQIEEISSVLELGRSGNLSLRISPGGSRELRTVSEQVNFFIETLESRTQALEVMNTTLEDRVAQRTLDLSEASAQLIEAEKKSITSRLVAGVAHEINNPIGIVVTAISLVDEKVTSLEQKYRLYSADPNAELPNNEIIQTFGDIRESLDIAVRNLNKAASLVRSFKSVSSDQLSLSRRVFLLDAVIDDILISLSPLLKKRRILLEKEIQSVEMDSYPGVFSHMLGNFVQNSLIHGFPENRKGNIRIRAVQDGETVLFTYEDNGEGIEPQVMETLFEPFVTTRRSEGSIGLGLNIVKNLVTEKLQGTIRVESTTDYPTRFVIRFPVNPPQDTE